MLFLTDGAGRRGGEGTRLYFSARLDRCSLAHFEKPVAPARGALCFGQLYFLKRRFEVVTGWKCHAARSPRPGPTPPPLLPRLNFRLYMCWPHMSPKLTFPTSLAPLHNLPYTFRPRRESRGPIAGSTFPPRRGYISSPFHEILIKSWTPLFTFLLVN